MSWKIEQTVVSFTVPRGMVDATVMCGGFEIQFPRQKDLIDMFFVNATGVNMSLNSFKDWEYHTSIEFDTMTSFIPFSIRRINRHKSFQRKCFGCICIRIACVSTEEAMIQKSRKRNRRAEIVFQRQDDQIGYKVDAIVI